MIREENSFSQAVETCAENLGYVHACENQRGIPGTGLVPWQEFFQSLNKIGYDGCITIESFDPNMENIAKLICIWRDLADSTEHLATEGLNFLKKMYQEAYGKN
jgi:D-psicose/D-tagatose/L-ribulose 3-epimerase